MQHGLNYVHKASTNRRHEPPAQKDQHKGPLPPPLRRAELRLREHASVNMHPKTTRPSAADAAMLDITSRTYTHQQMSRASQHLIISRCSKYDSQGKQTAALRTNHDSDAKYHGINWPLNCGRRWLKGQEHATPTANKPHAARPFLLRPITSAEPILTQSSTPVHPSVCCITLT